MTDSTDPQLTNGRSSDWRATFLEHFDALRNTAQVDTSLDVAYNDQNTTRTQEASPDLRKTPGHYMSASRETSPVFVVQSRESSPVFRISQSRSNTPGIGSSASRESTPAAYSRESTPVLSLDMNGPVQAATAMAWLEGAVRNVEPGVDSDRFRNLVAVPLAEEPAMERGPLYSQVEAVDDALAVALRTVLDTVEWGGEIVDDEMSVTADALSGD